jgi:hypothetical protein
MAKNYKVTDITERSNITRQGKVEKLYRVTADSAAGTTFTVEIPEADFNKEKVDQVLTEKATSIDEIRKL